MIPLEDLYARLPVVHCKGLCGAEVCGEVVPVAEREMPRLLDLALGGVLPESDLPGPCPFLDRQNRCQIYQVRPLVCRLHGAVPAETEAIVGLPPWRCPHGCEVDGKISAVEAARLMEGSGMFSGRRLSTSATLNRILEEVRAVRWWWRDGDLVVESEGP